jgi:uncharacterized OB-fold protein
VSDAALRPLPAPDEVTRPFWEACRRGELRMQRCAGCGRMRFTPRPMCPACRSMECEWVLVSGRGTVFSRVVCHPPLLPAFQPLAPYVVALVELAEDPRLRLVGNVQGCAPEHVHIGMPVRVVFEAISDEIHLPQWRPAEV